MYSKKYRQAVLGDIVAANDTMALLSDVHLMHLNSTGFLKTILENKKKEQGGDC